MYVTAVQNTQWQYCSDSVQFRLNGNGEALTLPEADLFTVGLTANNGPDDVKEYVDDVVEGDHGQ